MLPAHLAENIRQQVLFYLQSTFDFRDRDVEQAFERFLNDRDLGLFKGPWVQLRRPFRPADPSETVSFAFPVNFHPFKHQNRAWRRLSSQAGSPQPTIVTTGTGSGKTECFLFPILDHCLRARQTGQKGIKAIILYPMNALAGDQEKRFARLIWQTAALQQAGIRVGNYTGRYDPADPGAAATSGTKAMGEDHGISNREVQQEDPPDILLTNYKMLDYLLLRPQDQRLWRFNSPSPREDDSTGNVNLDAAGTINQPLKYLVLDELHTYDGAQGADVACLIRRLKERLGVAKGNLCVVGTSATLDEREPTDRRIGSSHSVSDTLPDAKETSSDRLANFAATLFEEDVDAEAVIGEDRLTVEEIIDAELQELALPDPSDCRPLDEEDALQYTIRQSSLWGGPVYSGPDIPPYLMARNRQHLTSEEEAALHAVEVWSVELGSWLKRRMLFKYLLEVFERAEAGREGPVTWNDMVEGLAREELGFSEHVKWTDRSFICASFFALVAAAKEIRSGHAFPLVPTQVQLWIRELRRVGRLVYEKPVYSWLDEPTQEYPSLPAFHCSECGDSGWVALQEHRSETKIGAKGVTGCELDADPTRIYRGWFGYKNKREDTHDPNIVVISPVGEVSSGQFPVSSAEGEAVSSAEESVSGKQFPVSRTERSVASGEQSVSSAEGGKNSGEVEQSAIELGEGLRQQEFEFKHWYLCPKSLVLRQGDGPCPLTNDPKRFRVRINKEIRHDDRRGALGTQGCPNCGSKEGVFFIGSQAATLSSVAIDELFGSVLNNDPKLLAFTDSVQDASHRAGFFTARTYRFTFRTALQHVLDAVGPEGVPLVDAGRRLLEWWSQPRPGWPGGMREALASLMPPDLHEYPDFVKYCKEGGGGEPPKSLRADIERRLTWEVTSEFGLMQTHGRTLEPAGSSSLGWRDDRISATVAGLRERVPAVDTRLVDVSDDALRLWIYGVLHRARIRGALDHPYLADFAKKKFWGKYPFGRAIAGRETFPPAGRYMPHLMVTQAQRGHDHVLAPSKGSQPPWHLVWARRALNQPNADESSLLDLIDTLLKVGTEAGLFVRLHQDGVKRFYAISAHAAMLYADRMHLTCSETQRALVRPTAEAQLWRGSPSVEYYADKGLYVPASYTPRQRYYQDRYRKGALRRVVASEHTGLLATEERERLEHDFSQTQHTDDPNVLTCTSTLEMGIDIGDMSSTMLCSIPPSTASYLQRIGRAGRATGTALIVSVVNQRPHDLFFYGRPSEMLRGKVDPPGCWLDASAVLARQYLAFGFDSATKSGELSTLPKSGRQLVEDLAKPEGHIPRLMAWMTSREAELRGQFLRRFQANVQPDTRERFVAETAAELLAQRVHQATGEFNRMLRDLENARKRLRDQLSKLDEEEQEARREIEQELRILQGRVQSLGRTTALEILTDNGLLPNYAFPERGVRFYGAIYNKHRRADQEHKPIEVTRPAGVALKELAPANHFYTHSRCFDIQQIAIGNPQQPLVEQWAVCGACGHMRPIEELNQPDAAPACPQCGHDRDSNSQLDRGQHRQFMEFSRSQSLSYMEQYESLSGDRSEERNREYYQVLRSFDLTQNKPAGAVGEEELPFGIEYRASVVMREVNVGYQGEPEVVPFGVDQTAPEEGFRICRDCGIAVRPGELLDKAHHRRSCSRRRANEKRRQKDQRELPYQWEHVYLYRELKSEAIRLLLPIADDEDVDTLTACIHLGLRLRFEGNPAHLIVSPQIMPDPASGMKRYYLVLLDAVPGGTGYLKTLYQEKDKQNRDGEGIMQVMRLARAALQTCTCRRLLQDPDRQDTDGCYRCIRTYHLQYNADTISRERGISLLGKLIEAGDKRKPQQALAAIKADSLFGSMLEKKFVDSLEAWVREQNGNWSQTIIRGSQGFRFSLPHVDRLWELELQPTLGVAHGVSVQSQPDFVLRSDDDRIKPLCIFTDGFEFHCHPVNRLADDMLKRRAILESGNYHVWNVTWADLDSANADQVMVCHAPVAHKLQTYCNAAKAHGKTVPDARRVTRNGLEQLKAFIVTPHAAGWTQLATFISFFPLNQLMEHRTVDGQKLRTALETWRAGAALPAIAAEENGEWVYNDRTALNQDVIAYITVGDAVTNRQNQVIILGRLGDSEAETTGSDFHERWRRFLACLNVYQFTDNFRFWAGSEVDNTTAPALPLEAAAEVADDWQTVLDDVSPSLRPYVHELAVAGLPLPDALPRVEYFNENIEDDAFAELAWPNCQPAVAVLAGGQMEFAAQWQNQGWKVFTPDDLQAKGITCLTDELEKGISAGA